jgi:hypothetical protein
MSLIALASTRQAQGAQIDVPDRSHLYRVVS